MFGEDEEQMAIEAQENGGFVDYKQLQSHYGSSLNSVTTYTMTSLLRALLKRWFGYKAVSMLDPIYLEIECYTTTSQSGCYRNRPLCEVLA